MTDPTGIKLTIDPTVQRLTGTTAHGYHPFDVPYISEIVPGLWQGGCTTGLALPHFIDHLVSLYPWERYKTFHELKSELYVRAYDSLDGGPERIQITHLAEWVNHCRDTGNVLVHCQAGLNRSSLVVAVALMEEDPTRRPLDVIKLLREQRSPAVLCNPSFEAMVLGW